MNVSLTPLLEDYVKQKVAAGLYSSVSEVMREALCLLQERDAIKEMKLAVLRRDLQEGIDELDQGKGTLLDMDDKGIDRDRVVYRWPYIYYVYRDLAHGSLDTTKQLSVNKWLYEILFKILNGPTLSSPQT